MERHAAFPHCEDLERIGGVVAGLVEQHITDPAADHRAHDAVEQQVLDVAAGPAGGGVLRLAGPSHREEQEQGETDQVSQAVPVDRDRQADLREVERDRIELGMNEHAEMIRGALWRGRSRHRRIVPAVPLPRVRDADQPPFPEHHRGRGACAEPLDVLRHRLRGRRLRQADDRRRQRALDITPCNAGLRRSPTPPSTASREAGGDAQIFGTPTVSDGITMGTEGMKYCLVSREVIADCIETVVGGRHGRRARDRRLRQEHARLHDGHRCALNVPAIFVYGGTILPGRHKGKDLDIVSHLRGGRPVHRRQDDERGLRRDRVRGASPARARAAACTPPTPCPRRSRRWACRCPYSPAPWPPCDDEKRERQARRRKRAGRAVEKNLKPRDIITKKSLENAFTVVMALGGSTNAVLHLMAIAHDAGVEWTLDDFERMRQEGAGALRPQALRAATWRSTCTGRRHPAGDEDAARGRACCTATA